MITTLPTDSNERKDYPLFRGLLRYFPAALAGVARISKAGNDKHNPGEVMHHARGKSTDHADSIIRHLMDLDGLLSLLARGGYTNGERATDEVRESILSEASSLAWRALALSQELHEEYGGAPLAPGARLPEPKELLPPTPLSVEFREGSASVFEGGQPWNPAAVGAWYPKPSTGECAGTHCDGRCGVGPALETCLWISGAVKGGN